MFSHGNVHINVHTPDDDGGDVLGDVAKTKKARKS